MRLIDKDLILETAKDKEWGLWCEIVNIKFAPEVEAIPIEWILHYVDTHYNVDNYDDIWRYIMKMHDEWEKENEQNKESTSQAN